MVRIPPLPGGELEYAVLAAVWDAGSASAPDVHANVGVPRRLAYTTVAKVLDRLHTKRLLARRRVGKAFVYTAKVPREHIDRARAGDLLRRLLGPEPVPAIATLVDAIEAIDPDLIAELSRQVAARQRSRRGS
jgi:BlaI family transcriptional regulator, penicillinase repressor